MLIFLVSKTSKNKLPAGVVPLFGSSGLFTPDEEKSVTFDDTSTVKSSDVRKLRIHIRMHIVSYL